MSKPKGPVTSTSKPLKMPMREGEDPGVALARLALRPSVRAAITAQTFSKTFGELDINALVDELAAQTSLANSGDMARSEAMLISQAHTLEAIFHELAGRAALNMGEYISAAEVYLRLALKAQSQCRATLETLAEMKNPRPMTFVKQANVAHGPQQVNNAPTEPPSRARGSENQPNKLLEQQHGERLDGGATPSAIGTDSAMATVEEVHRTKNFSR
jgi:hypothetical protein